MSFLRRLTAALSIALLLQLTLLGSGTLCSMPAGAGMGDADAAHAMAGMHAAGAAAQHGSAIGAPGSSRAAPLDHSGTPVGCEQSGGRNGCSLPWGAGQCATMNTCTTAPAAPAAPLLAQATTPHAVAPIAAASRFQSGPPAAPELPPPRA